MPIKWCTSISAFLIMISMLAAYCVNHWAINCLPALTIMRSWVEEMIIPLLHLRVLFLATRRSIFPANLFHMDTNSIYPIFHASIAPIHLGHNVFFSTGHSHRIPTLGRSGGPWFFARSSYCLNWLSFLKDGRKSAR